MAEHLAMEYIRRILKPQRFGAVALGVAVSLGGCGAGEGGPRQGSTPTVFATEDDGPQSPAGMLRDRDPCDISPIEGLPPNVAIVEGRCHPAPDEEVGIYPSPAQVPGTEVGEVYNDDLLMVDCIVRGDEELQNQAEADSDGWLRISTKGGDHIPSPTGQAYIPEIWVRHNGKIPACE